MDAGGIEIDDMDTYHPNSVTPSQRLVTDTRLPIRTRSRANVDMDDASLIHYTLTQLALKDGLKKFGQKAQDAIKTKLLQLHDQTVLDPVRADSLTKKTEGQSFETAHVFKAKTRQYFKRARV